MRVRLAIVAVAAMLMSGCGSEAPRATGGETAKGRPWRMIGPLAVPGGHAAVLHADRGAAPGAPRVVRDVVVAMPDGGTVSGTLSVDCRSGDPSWKGALAVPSQASGLAGSVLALGCRAAEGPTVRVEDAVSKLAAQNRADAQSRQAMLSPTPAR